MPRTKQRTSSSWHLTTNTFASVIPRLLIYVESKGGVASIIARLTNASMYLAHEWIEFENKNDSDVSTRRTEKRNSSIENNLRFSLSRLSALSTKADNSTLTSLDYHTLPDQIFQILTKKLKCCTGELFFM